MKAQRARTTASIHGSRADDDIRLLSSVGCARTNPLTARSTRVTRAYRPGLRSGAYDLPSAGEVAQLVEHTTENRGVAGSIPALAISGCAATGGSPAAAY